MVSNEIHVLVGKLFRQIVGCYQTSAEIIVIAWTLVPMKSGEGLKLTGLFSAERVKRAARTGRNPRTGEDTVIAEHKTAPGQWTKVTTGEFHNAVLAAAKGLRVIGSSD